MKVKISRKLLDLFRSRIDHNDYFDRVVNDYFASVKSDKYLLGETLMKEDTTKAVGIVSSPLTAILCTMLYLQPFKGAEVPIWVATNSERLTKNHILALSQRDCYFYPTAKQYLQWCEFVGIYREILGDVAYINDSLFLANCFCPTKIKAETELASIVTLPFSTSSLLMGYDDMEFYKIMANG